ncbi:MAG: hypothetical protein WBM53_18510 [Maribacter sp.]
MIYIVLVVLTVLSCILFEYSKLSATLKDLIASYKLQFKVMSDKTLDDQTKQKQLLYQISKQLILIGKLILGIVLFIAPFLSLFILQLFDEKLNPDILVTWWGITIPTVTVIMYIIFKRYYGNLHHNR